MFNKCFSNYCIINNEILIVHCNDIYSNYHLKIHICIVINYFIIYVILTINIFFLKKKECKTGWLSSSI